MKTKFTRMISLMLTLVMCFSMLNITAFAVGQSSAIQIVEQGGKVYYLAEPQEGEVAGEDNFDVWTSKTIAGTENEDEFEVTLQVGTTMKAIPNDVAVVLVMDASGSMMMDKNGKKWGNKGELPTDGTKLRIDYAKEAALEFADQLVENSGGAQRMLSVVEFGNNAMTVLPWTNANDNGMLRQSVADAISSVDVNFVHDNCSFWDEEFLKTWNYDVYNALKKDGGVGQRVQAENWSYEPYTHETKSFFEANFVSYEQSFMSDYVTTMETETVEDVEVTRCTYPGCKKEYDHTHCTVDGCTDPTNHTHCTYSGCTSTEVDHTHCAYEGCMSGVADHKHCAVCGVSDAKVPNDTHCTYAGCTETAEHTHCTYSICANPAGHKHCERACWCEEDHTHCKDIQDVCGRTDVHQHITGCTVFFCQDTTPDHKHACLHGAVTSDKKVYQYPFYDYKGGTGGGAAYQLASARCLNSDPTHTHDVYDGDTYTNSYVILNRVDQKYRSIGTNMEGGLMLARNLVNAGQAKGGAIEGIDDVYVIILSDGGPTYHVNQSVVQNADAEVNYLPGERGGGNYATWDDVADIVSSGEAGDVAIAEDIKAVSDFYAILYGTGLGETLGGSHQLSGITGEQWFKTENGSEQGLYNYIGADAVFNSLKADELNTVFAEIKNRIDVLAKAWTVNDELSSDVTFGQFVENGQYAGFTPASGDKEAAVSWSLGAMKPECGSGTVSDPYIYTLKYTVQLNSAKDNVKETSLAYDANEADENSNISLPGVWTGTNTQLQYLMLEKEQLDTMTPDQIQEKLREAAFEDVSVKGLYADYEFIKKNKETDETIEGAGFTLYDADGKVYGSEVFSDSEGKVTFTDIPKGEYTMKETTAPSGMQQMSDLESVISWGMITAKNGGEMDDVIYNIPIPIPGKINIFVEKVWNDSNDVNGKRPESITVQLMANGNAVSDKTLTLNAGNNWSGSFDNLDEYEGDIEIVYTIAEVEVPEGYESVITGDAETGFTVTNTYTEYVHTLGSILVTKNTSGAATPADATFQLQKMEGNEWINVGEPVAYSAFVENAYTFTELEEGTYRVVESGAEIEEFHLETTYGENIVLTKTTTENGDTSVSSGSALVTNIYTPYIHTPGTITVNKIATGAATPTGATFQLQKLNGEMWNNVGAAVPFTAFVNNAYTFTGLGEGTYRVIESGAEIEAFRLETTYGENVVLTRTTADNGDSAVNSGSILVTNTYDPFVHTPGTITVNKIATGAATPADATFQLQKLNGETWTNVGEAVAYSAFVENAYTFAELEEGTYRIVESGAEVEGYTLETTYSANVVLTKTTADNGDTAVDSNKISVTNAYAIEEKPTEPEETEPEDNIEIPDEDVPLASTPVEEEEDDLIEIPDEDVPMADVPKTGDLILPFLGMAIASGAATFFAGKTDKKKEDEE